MVYSQSTCCNFLFKIIFTLFLATSVSAEKGSFAPWGNDNDLSITSTCKHETKVSTGSEIACSLLTFFQKVISPIDGPRSNFRPTSSRYMQLAIERYGFGQGFIMGLDRLMRENEEKWVYRTIDIGKITYKYDPAFINKSQR